MFTGIVEDTAVVVSLTEQAASWRLILDAPHRIADSLAVGDSLACNGCCLTLVKREATHLHFDLLAETLRLTNLDVAPGSRINLERSLAANARLGGHFVSGHVDCLGTICELKTAGKDTYVRVQVPADFTKWLVYKGSIAIDGISLTVAEAHDDGFAVWLIPHTLEVTNLHQRKIGDSLNLEFDLLAKYAEKILKGQCE